MNFKAIMEKNMMLVDGASYPEWIRKLTLILTHEGRLHVLEQEPLVEPLPTAPAAERESYKAKLKELTEVKCLMLATMSAELDSQHQDMTPAEIFKSLEGMFKASDRQERYVASTSLFRRTMPVTGKVDVHIHVVMKDVQKLKSLGFELPQELVTDLVLSSLPNSFSQFVMNFNMNKMDASLPNLLPMLTTAEKELQKGKGQLSSQVLVVSQPNKKKREGKSKEGKKSSKKKAKTMPKNWQNPTSNEKEASCFLCGKKGHFKKNCTEKKKG